jgi:hypothetical protein
MRPPTSTTLAISIQAAARCISIFGSVDSAAAVVGRTMREWRDARRVELAGAVVRRLFFPFGCCQAAVL